MKKVALLALSTLALSACAPSAYVESNPSAIQFGVSSIQDVKNQGSGGKELEDNITINNQPIHTLTYRYMESAAFFGLEAKTRYTTYFFYNNKLVGKETSSRFDNESTEFDVDKAKTIKNGATRQQVVAELGKPSGTFIYPIAKNPGDTGIAYYNAVIHPVPFVGEIETVHEALVSLNNDTVDNVLVTDDTHALPFDTQLSITR